MHIYNLESPNPEFCGFSSYLKVFNTNVLWYGIYYTFCTNNMQHDTCVAIYTGVATQKNQEGIFIVSS